MLKRFFELEDYLLGEAFANEKIILDYLPSPLELSQLQDFFSSIKNLHSVTLALQTDFAASILKKRRVTTGCSSPQVRYMVKVFTSDIKLTGAIFQHCGV